MSSAGCPLLKHLPKDKVTGVEHVDNANKRARDAFADVISLLWQHRELASDIAIQIRKEIDAKHRAAQLPEATHFQKCTTLGALPEDFQNKVILDHSKITPGTLGTARVRDGKGCSLLLSLMLNAKPSLPIPDCAKKKAVCYRALHERILQVGDRMKDVTDADFWDAGKLRVRYEVIGVYRFQAGSDGKKVARIIHRPTGAVAVPKQSVAITVGAHEIINNHLDSLAECLVDGAHVFMHELTFAEGTGPKKHPEMKGKCKVFAALCQSASEEQGKAEATASVSTGMSEEQVKLYTTPVKEFRQAVSQQAVRKLQEAKAGAEKKRRFSVVASAVAAE